MMMMMMISRGVREGGVLSAFLFSLYVEDILHAVINEESGCYIGIRKINIQAYAADIVIYCPTSIELQENWTCAREHDLAVNLDVMKAMKFGKNRANIALNKNVGTMLRQFGTVDFKIKIKLFNSLCVHLHGSQLWYNRRRALNSYKSLAVSYHNAPKRIIGHPKYYSNQLTLNICSVSLH